MVDIKQTVKIERFDAPISTALLRNTKTKVVNTSVNSTQVLKPKDLHKTSIKADVDDKKLIGSNLVIKHSHLTNKNTLILAIGVGVAFVSIISATFVAFRKN